MAPLQPGTCHRNAHSSRPRRGHLATRSRIRTGHGGRGHSNKPHCTDLRSDTSKRTGHRGPRCPPVVPRDQGTNLTASPPPPTLTTSPEQYRTAEAVATQYLQVWCWQPAAAPANSNLTNTAPWITPAGQADDLTRSATWLPSLTSICGPVTVTQIGEQPSAPDRTLLQLSTRQAYINTSGVIVSQQRIEQTRRIVRGPDGRWLVDTQVQAG